MIEVKEGLLHSTDRIPKGTPLALLPGERLEVEFETYYGLNQTAERDKERTEITVQCF